MREEIQKKADQEILNEIEALGKLTPGENNHKVAVDSLQKLYSLRIDEAKIEAERQSEMEEHEKEMELKKRELDLREKELSLTEKDLSQKSDDLKKTSTIQLIGIAVSGGIALFTLGFDGRWMKRVLKFEETGTIASFVGKNVFTNVFKPKKLG